MRVEQLSEKFGEYLNLDYQEIINLSLLAKLHDIGKVSISEEILKKPGKLNKNEWSIMQQHCKRGYEIANSITEFSPIAKYILYHHERWDGRGYPEGLMGEEIPLLSRIITIVDSFDVMTHARPYTEAISVEQAFKELKECSGSQFDADLVYEFCKMFINDK
ncbi:HD domain-containing protein [Halanaerobium saccharolyticum]|uniref:HD domain-containing protein n=1 Tax=Halanaerobium saccharolyticum TaxID=43595 RepID=A0A4R6LHJ2_9FIRM|nr:HD domain-containing phosphohydrolase [Halanaerobium saccharolyticum]TDO83384.1 HD domain-containing protein [Halanaerobium saccharolyticum]